MQEGQLLVERHLLQNQFGTLFRGQFRIHPRPIRVLGYENTGCGDDSDGKKQ
jgi:hypothetical protein